VAEKKLIERQDLDAFLGRLSQIEGRRLHSIRESERPDFIVTFGGAPVGVETTRTVYQECARVLKMQASKHPDQWVNLTHLVDGRPRRTNSELARSMGANALLQPWKPVKQAMLDWKQKVAFALNSKRQKLGQAGYQVLGENWLLIHDIPPLSLDGFTRPLVFQHLGCILSQPLTTRRDFEKIFIHSGAWLFRWCQGTLEVAGPPG